VKKFNREKELFLNDKIELRYGTVNRINPNVVYVVGNTWVVPKYEGDYKRDVLNIVNRFKKLLRKKVNDSDTFDNNIVCDFDIKFATLRQNKKNCITFEIFLKQNSKNDLIEFNSLSNKLNEIFKEIVIEFLFDLKEKSFIVNRNRNFEETTIYS
jgi:hypothetical protein